MTPDADTGGRYVWLVKRCMPRLGSVSHAWVTAEWRNVLADNQWWTMFSTNAEAESYAEWLRWVSLSPNGSLMAPPSGD